MPMPRAYCGDRLIRAAGEEPGRGWYSQAVQASAQLASPPVRARRPDAARGADRAAKQGQLSGIIFWAALIGICGAFTGVGFRASVRLVQRLLDRTFSRAWSKPRSCCPGGRASRCRPSAGPVRARCCGLRGAYCARRATSTTWRPWPSATASWAAAPRCCRPRRHFSPSARAARSGAKVRWFSWPRPWLRRSANGPRRRFRGCACWWRAARPPVSPRPITRRLPARCSWLKWCWARLRWKASAR
jgi:hypothetical protein